jgi:phospholipase C
MSASNCWGLWAPRSSRTTPDGTTTASGTTASSKAANSTSNGGSAIGQIKTVVVLVMENRSFDHMFGFMKRLNSEIDGLTGTESNPLSLTNPAGVATVSDQAPYVDPADPGHSYQDIVLQIFGSHTDTSANPPPMNGFAADAESKQAGLSSTIMSGFAPEHIPVHAALVQEFAVVDRWFASVPSSTQPNRLFLHSATSHGLMSNNTKLLADGLPQKTIFEVVHEAGLTFGIYYQQIPNTLFYRNLRQLKYLDKFYPYDLCFLEDAKRGVLPNYTVIEPRYFDILDEPANDDHPVHDVAQGQKLIKEVYEALRASPQWNEILLIITYDEHGGFHDHVPTPVADVPSPDGLVGSAPPYSFDFKRLGVRVPALLISPWIEKGIVVHEPNGPTPTSQYEHSSIPATVKKLFNLQGPFLTARDAWAGTFDGVLSLNTPRTDCLLELPAAPSSLRPQKTNESSPLSEFQEELVTLGSSLKGHLPPLTECNTVKKAHAYVTDAVDNFFKAASAASKAGLPSDTKFQLNLPAQPVSS